MVSIWCWVCCCRLFGWLVLGVRCALRWVLGLVNFVSLLPVNIYSLVCICIDFPLDAL